MHDVLTHGRVSIGQSHLIAKGVQEVALQNFLLRQSALDQVRVFALG